jgi:hypothetical protein
MADISDKKDVIKKLRNQIKPLAVSVSFWWMWGSETLQGLAVEKTWKTTLLPVVYWHQHISTSAISTCILPKTVRPENAIAKPGRKPTIPCKRTRSVPRCRTVKYNAG